MFLIVLEYLPFFKHIADVVTYNSLIDGYFLVNEVKHAKYVFHSMAQRGVTPDVQCYTIMIDGLCKKKMVDEAMSLFEEMKHKNMFPNHYMNIF